ncbi:hypothetical protein SAMN05660461_5787 [Chitinophaga ginsengisegetis]|uniref:Uncharacterized protein n=1 Tax=Chitinophaga ginsengisegetis TaxID=393003 RepID=A0A1T5PAX7_9BACT|nr:hypothetical protein [Chitinophaga ginsengisegetis]SKD09894.1 hypothetical protein SAMN05660461_5787 [Chitinophaga ginsengisegetis]
MKINPNRKGLVIGALFTAISLMLVATVIAPALAVLPGYPVEKMMALMVSGASDHHLQLLTILVLAVIFLLILIPALILIRSSTPPNESIVSGKIILLMVLLYMVVHPLVFYIFSYAKDWNRKDAQYLMAALVTVPFSSFAFVIVGAVIDAVKKRG